jgi:hypothetical protein
MISPLWQKGGRGDLINDNLLHIFFTTARHSREARIKKQRNVDPRVKPEDDKTRSIVVIPDSCLCRNDD